MPELVQTVCPGCGINMPASADEVGHAYINASAECWGLYGEVLAFEYGNAIAFGQVHQLTVDAYAAQHPGGAHPHKSVDVHLAGLYAAFELGWPQSRIPQLRQRLTEQVRDWPHFEPPREFETLNVWDVALASSIEEHIAVVRNWSSMVWECWSNRHREIANLVDRHASL